MNKITALNNPTLYVEEGQYVKIEREMPENRLLELEVEGETGIFLAQMFKRITEEPHQIGSKPKEGNEELTSFSSIGHLNGGGKSAFLE